jgi:adenine-specific DNA-methyltransferase
VDQGVLIKGRGRGGSVQRALDGGDAALTLQPPEIPESARQPRPKQGGLPIQPRKPGEPVRARRGAPAEEKVLAYRHDERRVNNPEVGLVNPEDDADERETTYAYDPHIDPALQFDIGRHDIEKLIDDALESGDDAVMRKALQQLKRQAAPYLNWTGKAERTSFEVDTVSLHVHERIDPATILAVLKKRLKGGKVSEDGAQYQDDMFRAWFDRPLPLREAIEFYRHDRGWANRLIAGDSLLVMNSLIQKESMAGQVQMMYIDPPYGIKYGSNFQPFTHKRDVKDRKDEDLTQEPEMIKAFRDTWELGIHSYLTYLRDRLLLAKDLLHESGSVFVQISDENLHHVRELLDDTFGIENYCSTIQVQKTGSQEGALLGATVDFLIWYAKDKPCVKYRQLYVNRSPGDKSYTRYDYRELSNGATRRASKVELLEGSGKPEGFDGFSGKAFRFTSLISDGQASAEKTFAFRGRAYAPKASSHWKTPPAGLARLGKAGRIDQASTTVRYKRYLDDFPVIPVDDRWESMQIGKELVYVVQTAERVIERCLLMTTDPGDLVLDPTCGSGTTAFVAEKWGRRWITCDTSRVAVTLAKQRLMTASYDYYDLKYPHEGLRSGFIYKTVPHVTLKSIANNPDIDDIYGKLHPAIEQALADLNAALHAVPPSQPYPPSGGRGLTFKVAEGGRKGVTIDLAREALLEWEVPFDFPEDWPKAARKPFDAFHAARQAMQQKMDASIAAHADPEILYDQPQVARDKLRITGPFTVEAVPFATVLSLEEAEQPKDADTAIARSGESARQHSWRDELLKTGIRGKGGQILRFAELETLPGTSYLHCTGALADSGERVVVSFGPEYAALEQRQVALALNEAEKLRPAPKFIVFAAFTFDPEAAKDIDETRWPGVTLLKAQMNTDLLTEDLKKKQRGNQSFWLMGQPEVAVRKRKDGKYEVEVNGFDYFDTGSGKLESGGKNNIAVWLLDTDYDERSLYPRQVFFPMAGAKDGWHKLKKAIRAELDESRLEQFHGTVSLPFEIGDNRRIAVKIVDDRGIESLKVVPLD